MRYDEDHYEPESPLRLFNSPLLALCLLGCFCILASYSYGKYVSKEYAPIVQVTAPKPHAKQYFEHLKDRQLAEVYGLTPEDVSKPVQIWKVVP